MKGIHIHLVNGLKGEKKMDYREPWYDDDPDRQYVPSDVQKLHYSHEESAHTSVTNQKELDNYVEKVAKAFHKYKGEMWWRAHQEKLKGTYHNGGKYDTLINRYDSTDAEDDSPGEYDVRVADSDSGDASPGGVM